ncbi:MAG: ribosome small subunit-dependent GTPase A [Gemmatimonadota bacterium]|nr:ribosome small subunit-dependent GTPase A [Gemmatimonadota bacterium]
MEHIEGIVIREHRRHYYVAAGSRVVDCAVSSKLRKQLQYPEAAPGSRRKRVQAVRRTRVVDPVAIGDHVRIDTGEGNTGLIREILPRRNKISRRASGSSRKEQILAANIDQLIPVFSVAEPPPEWRMLDRMLAVAEWCEIPAAICLNKLDLPCPAAFETTASIYQKIGYPVVFTSVISNSGKEAFLNLLRNRMSLFMGPSGVGKSSLLNWLQPGLELRTREVSETTGEGRHTTTHTELVELEAGGMVGDLPGMREFHLWEVDTEEIPGLFPEFRNLSGHCRFRDCTHVGEPGCIVRDAVDREEVSRQRYESYLQLRKNP